ncbi:hypothetical protein DH2020_049150 [Rehmannia glutinosa]|uniref:DUF4378 domain-containing protein n=1 Tax=Rehmannia glutinosa TaxID=99300 RepID=A0ABR0U4I7_REHGL
MDSRLIKPKALLKPLLLKDYLLDDMSSCSSNGFKSFPRRQCCASTVRFLIEIDLKNKQQQQKKYLNFNKSSPSILRNPSKSALAALQSVITAVKRIPFAAARSAPENKNIMKSILPRSLSKKILWKSSFWKRKSNQKEIGRLKSFDQLLKENSDRLDISNSSMTTTSDDGKSKSWSGSDFTASSECTSGNSSSKVNLDLPEVRNDTVELLENGDVSTDSITTSDISDASTNSSTKTHVQKQWSVNEDKEQFSPVSVLDCPFDDDEEVSSPFQHRLAHMEGTQKKLMKKIQRFGCLAQLEPVSLAKQFALLPESNNVSTISPLQHSSASIGETVISENIEEEQEQEGDENQAEQMALDLLKQMNTSPSYDIKYKADKLLLDFFREKITAHQNVHSQRQWGENSFDEEMLEEAENWIDERKPRELFLEWEVPKNRQAYINDMEKGREWKSLDQENKEVALELEDEVFAALLNELLLDISSMATV